MPKNIYRKLVIVGDLNCGKTTVLLTFKHGRFPSYIPPVCEAFSTNFDVNGQEVSLDICDTFGEEGYEKVRPLSYPYVDVVLICFSTDSRFSFENVSEIWEPEVRNFMPRASLIIVATKTDLRKDPETTEKLKKFNLSPISTEEGQSMANKIRATYMECSAKHNDGVRELFEVAARASVLRDMKTDCCCIMS